LERHLDRRLREVIRADDGAALGRTVWEHACLFALHLAQYRLLEDAGVVVDHVVGHSLGETAAAHLAGVFSLADA
jgi:pimaricinolide synthase PimS1